MLRRAVEFSAGHSGLILSLAALTAAYGIYVLFRAQFDLFPEFLPPQVIVQTEAPGLSPRQVEELVTRPIEDAVHGTSGLESVRSQSVQSLSVITAVFKDGTDILKARQLVSERLSQAAPLIPRGARPPTLTPLTSAAGKILEVGLTSEKRSLMELRTLADAVVRPRLLAVTGVAKVVVHGGEVRQIQVQGSTDRLQKYGMTIRDLVEAVRESTVVRGLGFIETQNQRMAVVSEVRSPVAEQLGETVLGRRHGKSILIKDVARVLDGPRPKVGEAAVQGRPAVIISVSSRYGADTAAVGRKVEKALEELIPVFTVEGVTFHPSLFRASAFVDTARRNVTRSLIIGGVLVVLALFLFFWNVGTVAIPAAAICFSILIAVVALGRFGPAIDLAVLGGLTLAIGEVVGDAVVDVENVLRRLRRSRAGAARRMSLAVDASVEVRKAVVHASFLAAIVFLPALGLPEHWGWLLRPLALAYVFAVSASLLVALTATPALSRMLLARRKRPPPEPPAVQNIRKQYGRLLDRFLLRPGLASGGALVLFAGVFAVAPFLRSSFLPEFQEDNLTVRMTAVPGTSLQVSLDIGRRVTERLMKDPNVATVTQKAGRAENSGQTWGPNISDLNLVLNSSAGISSRVKSDVRAIISNFPELDLEVNSAVSERVAKMIAGAPGQLVVEIFGDDLDESYGKAREIAQALSRIKGAVDVRIQSPPGAPELVMRLRPERLQQFGLRPMEVLEAAETACRGSVVAQLFDGIGVYGVAVTTDPELRKSPEYLGALPVPGRAGTSVPLGELADFHVAAGRAAIDRIGGRRVQVVSSSVSGRTLSSFVTEARREIGKISFPAGSGAVLSAETAWDAQGRRRFLLYAGIAASAAVLLLALAIGEIRLLLLMLVAFALAPAGGLLAVFFTGRVLTLGSMVGFVSLLGVTARNSVLLVFRYRHLVSVEGRTWGREAALRGALERFNPTAMTALITGLGFLPLAVGAGSAGHEIEGPMAVVILGGLATSTLLNLLVLPPLALRYARIGK